MGTLPIRKNKLVDTIKMYAEAQKIINEFGLNMDSRER